jgi:hypothetical protein
MAAPPSPRRARVRRQRHEAVVREEEVRAEVDDPLAL